MAVVYKLIPLFIAWAGICMVICRGCAGRRSSVVLPAVAGYAMGVGCTWMLFRAFSGDAPFGIIRNVTGASFLLMWGIAVVALYRSTGRETSLPWGERFVN